MRVCTSCRGDYEPSWIYPRTNWCLFCMEDFESWLKHKNSKEFEPLTIDWSVPSPQICSYCARSLSDEAEIRVRPSGKNCEDQSHYFHTYCVRIVDDWKNQEVDWRGLFAVSFSMVPMRYHLASGAARFGFGDD